MRSCRHAAPIMAAALALAGPGPAGAQDDGVTESSILFGQSAALSGPGGPLSTEFCAGLLAAFHEANARGGVHGRKLELLSLDDRSEPERAIANTRLLIDEERVFALVGFVGAPTARATVPMAAAADVPFIAPLTGAAFLREKHWTNVVNLRASHQQETAEIVERLVADLAIRRVAVLHQDDSLGLEDLAGVEAALSQRGLTAAGSAVYQRNTSAVKTAVLELRAVQPEAVILLGAFGPVANAVAWSRKLGLDPIFATTSMAEANALAEQLRGTGEFGVYATEVIPQPWSDERAARAFRRAMAAHSSRVRPGFVSFEGYLAGRLAIEGLERSGQAVDRVIFLESLLEGDPIDFGGFRLRFTQSRNQGSDQVFLKRIAEDGEFVAVSRVERGP